MISGNVSFFPVIPREQRDRGNPFSLQGFALRRLWRQVLRIAPQGYFFASLRAPRRCAPRNDGEEEQMLPRNDRKIGMTEFSLYSFYTQWGIFVKKYFENKNHSYIDKAENI